MSRMRSRKEVGIVLAKKIRTLREERYPEHGGGRKIAAELNVLPQQWSQWETGRRIPARSQLVKIAEFFGVDLDELLPSKIEDTLEHEKKIDEARNKNNPFKSEVVPEAAMALNGSLEVIEVIGKLRHDVTEGSISPVHFTAMMQDVLKYIKFMASEAKRRTEEDA